jgi:hypothetical protein
MCNLIKKIKGWFSPIHTDTFGWTAEDDSDLRKINKFKEDN